MKKISLSLPISALSTPKIHLVVRPLPNMYAPEAEQSFKTFENNKQMLLEYIPEGETFHNYSEILTVHAWIGNRVCAFQVIQGIAEGIRAQSKNFKILEQFKLESIRDLGNEIYKESSVGVSYVHGEFLEVLYICYFSGPYDACGVQFMIRLKKEADEAEVLKALEKAKESVNKSVNVIKF